MNLFISFSGTAREEFAIKFLNFFNNYGIHCWYDQHELFLGDNLKDSIIKKGIESANYCIIIINQTFLSRNWPCEEAKKLYESLEERKNHAIFPILLDITKEEVKNSKLDFLLNIKYQFLRTGEDINNISLQILNRIFHDIASQTQLGSIDKALNYFKRLTLANSIDIYNALKVVNNLISFLSIPFKQKFIYIITHDFFSMFCNLFCIFSIHQRF